MPRAQSLSPSRRYTANDDDVIRRLWNDGVPSPAIGAALDPPATAPAIRVRARRLGLPMRRPSYAAVGDYQRIDGGGRREYVPSAVPPRNKPEPKPKVPSPSDNEKLEAMRRKAAIRQRLEAFAEERRQAPATGIRCWCGEPGDPVVCAKHKRQLVEMGVR